MPPPSKFKGSADKAAPFLIADRRLCAGWLFRFNRYIDSLADGMFLVVAPGDCVDDIKLLVEPDEIAFSRRIADADLAEQLFFQKKMSVKHLNTSCLENT
jgi:hypothetical protein